MTTLPPPPPPDVRPIVDMTRDRRTSRTTDTYVVGGWCHNCSFRFRVRCRKGDETPLMVECPNCEVTVFRWRAYDKDHER